MDKQKLTAASLVAGGQFRTTPRQRKNRTAYKILYHAPEDMKAPESLRGKYMIIVAGCAQIVVDADQELYPAI